MRAKSVNEDIKHLPGRSKEEIMAIFRRKRSSLEKLKFMLKFSSFFSEEEIHNGYEIIKKEISNKSAGDQYYYFMNNDIPADEEIQRNYNEWYKIKIKEAENRKILYNKYLEELRVLNNKMWENAGIVFNKQITEEEFKDINKKHFLGKIKNLPAKFTPIRSEITYSSHSVRVSYYTSGYTKESLAYNTLIGEVDGEKIEIASMEIK